MAPRGGIGPLAAAFGAGGATPVDAVAEGVSVFVAVILGVIVLLAVDPTLEDKVIVDVSEGVGVSLADADCGVAVGELVPVPESVPDGDSLSVSVGEGETVGDGVS
jgi:hypothetical protein